MGFCNAFGMGSKLHGKLQRQIQRIRRSFRVSIAARTKRENPNDRNSCHLQRHKPLNRLLQTEEATFGRGALFDIKDDIQFVTMPEQPQEGATDEEIAVFQQQAMEAQAIFQDRCKRS